ncbi:protein of unknown function [Pseudodesulfovibrio profundus]|uniref:Uncharacterized protein n=1 Tax=Pseudodesulfovibrio profundus TaxID=57320 RepID=A0A2C8F8R7_9BACT|nr:protein of unknown function [Pseudodesulfovibrio profundus]
MRVYQEAQCSSFVFSSVGVGCPGGVTSDSLRIGGESMKLFLLSAERLEWN